MRLTLIAAVLVALLSSRSIDQACGQGQVGPSGGDGSPAGLPHGWTALPAEAVSPTENSSTPEKVALGKMLFFDPRLSITGTVSCNSCHNLMEGGDDGRPTSMGVQGLLGPRNAPTVWNAAFMSTQFWDGRAETLEEQAGGPLLAPPEMGMPSHDFVIRRIAAIPGYRQAFAKAFRENPTVTIETAVQAIASFERKLITPNSAYDRYATGDSQAMRPQQVRGMRLFDQIGCATCHEPPLFGGEFHEFPAMPDPALADQYDLGEDTGRAEVTGAPLDRYQFKTPTLRNITLTAPYLHNGSAATLEETIRLMAMSQLGDTLTGPQVEDVVAFLEALEGAFPEMQLPRLPSKSGISVLNDDAL